MNSNFFLNKLKELIDEFIKNTNEINTNKLKEYILKHKNKSDLILPYLNYLDNKNGTTQYLDLYNNLLKLKEEDKYKKGFLRNDIIFKNDVKENANFKCQITNTHLKGCEVAHILDFQYCNYNCDKYSPYNGLLLKTQLHRYWDKDYLKLDFDIDIENKKEVIFFVLNYDKIKLEDNYDKLITDIKKELCFENNTFNATDDMRYFLNFKKEDFDEYKYYISLRNDYH